MRWANRHKLTNLQFPATRWHGPSRAIDTEARWHQARRHLHEDTIKPADKVAGLLLLLYAQTPAAISRLTVEHLDTTDQLRLRLGREPLLLPEPISELASTRRGHAALGDQGNSPWLFPGGQPGRPISAYQLAQRLRKIGIRPAQAALHRANQPRRRTARRHPRQTARHPHQSCHPVAARRRRRLDNLRRPLQPPSEHLNRQPRATADSPRT